MVIGGQAVILYGEPRLTRDIDITLGLGREGLPQVLGICDSLSLNPLPDNIDDFVEKTLVLPTLDENTGLKVDFIFSFSPYARGAIPRAKRILLDDTSVNFAAPEDLIIHKIFAHRARDIEDVKIIFRKNPGTDLEYIKKWLSEFDALNPNEGLLDILIKLIKEIKP